MKLFSLKQVELTGGYLFEKQELNRNVTIHAVYDRFSESGRIGAFDFAWKEGMPHQPHVYYDSDVAKWMEGASWILCKHDEPLLTERVERLIDRIERHQQPDGYFNIYYTVCKPGERFTDRNMHELYCAGHLFEAAVAYAVATGRERFLHCMERYADCIYRIFVEEQSAAFTTPGHEEIELALLSMYRYTGNPRHLELAKWFLEKRGGPERDVATPAQNQSHLPVREQTQAVGHAVRAMYLYTAMAELAHLTGDGELLSVCKQLYADVTEKKMYVTGGIGSTRVGEAFTVPCDLPNEEAYAETCASIALLFFCKRMQENENLASYGDTVERALYNGVLSGLSPEGNAFFYENPLEITLADRYTYSWGGPRPLAITKRVHLFDCSCCPPNLNRLLPRLGEYLYGQEGDTLYVNQYAGSRLHGEGISCTMETDYPRDGRIRLTAEGVGKVALRIPAWCKTFTLNRPYELRDGYAYVENGGEILLTLDMEPFAVYASPRVAEDAGRLCVQMGPVVYCAEGRDNGGDLHTLALPTDFACQPYERKRDARIGLDTLAVKGYRMESEAGGLYTRTTPSLRPETIRLIPYNSFASRGESDMRVWLSALLR
ncbi:MAG: glycoside hydrolase family 127 protein [Oscillospiraceae bacterium]|nr:glycoside hydrolase family 127 protein [Oscillospiraceae bacterium]